MNSKGQQFETYTRYSGFEKKTAKNILKRFKATMWYLHYIFWVDDKEQLKKGLRHFKR